jgi:hypothetical protein
MTNPTLTAKDIALRLLASPGFMSDKLVEREAFGAALANIGNGPHQPGSLARVLEVDEMMGGAKALAAYQSWLGIRDLERKRQAESAMLANTVEVQAWRGDKLGKPSRMPLADLDAWIKPGHHVVSEATQSRGRGFDSSMGQVGPTMSVRSFEIGTEREDGTIVAKRIVVLDGKRQTQYLVRPRSKTAEAKYQRQIRVAEIKHLITSDMVGNEELHALRAELAQIESK